MKFGEIKKGDVIYVAIIKNSEIQDQDVKTKNVTEVYLYKDNGGVEIHFDDDSMIIPGQDEEYVVSGMGCLTNILNPFNFTIFATSHDACAMTLSRIISTKMAQLSEDYKKINIQMARLCLMSSVAREIESKSSVVLEPVYAD